MGGHVDDRQLSGPLLCTVSLACDAHMTYQQDPLKVKQLLQRQPSGGGGGGIDTAVHRVFLPRRSLQIQTGKVRFEYQHAIANADLEGDRRVSVTFRKEKTGRGS